MLSMCSTLSQAPLLGRGRRGEYECSVTIDVSVSRTRLFLNWASKYGIISGPRKAGDVSDFVGRASTMLSTEECPVSSG